MKAKLPRNGDAPKQLVHFEYADAAARTVCIAGTFNDWHSSVSEMINLGSGKWVKDLELAPGVYEYRFVVDGKWVTDRRCPNTVSNPFGDTNSLLIVAEPESAQQPRRKSDRSEIPLKP